MRDFFTLLLSFCSGGTEALSLAAAGNQQGNRRGSTFLSSAGEKRARQEETVARRRVNNRPMLNLLSQIGGDQNLWAHLCSDAVSLGDTVALQLCARGTSWFKKKRHV